MEKAKVTKEEIIKKLKTVIDPELGVNIVELGLIYKIIINGENVKIKMTLTSMGCPMSSYFVENVKNAVKKVKGIKKADIELTFDPPWTPKRLSKEAKAKLDL